MPGDESADKLREGLVSIQRCRRRNNLVDQRIGVLASRQRPGADQAAKFGDQQQVPNGSPKRVWLLVRTPRSLRCAPNSARVRNLRPAKAAATSSSARPISPSSKPSWRCRPSRPDSTRGEVSASNHRRSTAATEVPRRPKDVRQDQLLRVDGRTHGCIGALKSALGHHGPRQRRVLSLDGEQPGDSLGRGGRRRSSESRVRRQLG